MDVFISGSMGNLLRPQNQSEASMTAPHIDVVYDETTPLLSSVDTPTAITSATLIEPVESITTIPIPPNPMLIEKSNTSSLNQASACNDSSVQMEVENLTPSSAEVGKTFPPFAATEDRIDENCSPLHSSDQDSIPSQSCIVPMPVQTSAEEKRSMSLTIQPKAFSYSNNGSSLLSFPSPVLDQSPGKFSPIDAADSTDVSKSDSISKNTLEYAALEKPHIITLHPSNKPIESSPHNINALINNSTSSTTSNVSQIPFLVSDNQAPNTPPYDSESLLASYLSQADVKPQPTIVSSSQVIQNNYPIIISEDSIHSQANHHELHASIFSNDSLCTSSASVSQVTSMSSSIQDIFLASDEYKPVPDPNLPSVPLSVKIHDDNLLKAVHSMWNSDFGAAEDMLRENGRDAKLPDMHCIWLRYFLLIIAILI